MFSGKVWHCECPSFIKVCRLGIPVFAVLATPSFAYSQIVMESHSGEGSPTIVITITPGLPYQPPIQSEEYTPSREEIRQEKEYRARMSAHAEETRKAIESTIDTRIAALAKEIGGAKSEKQLDQKLAKLKRLLAEKKAAAEEIKRQTERLRDELKTLELTIDQKYPDGRPSGIGILAFYTPGDNTIGMLKFLTDNIRNVGKEHGAVASCAVALASTVAVPFVIAWGGLADSAVAIGELAVGNPKHGDADEYDRILFEIRNIRQKLDVAGGHSP